MSSEPCLIQRLHLRYALGTFVPEVFAVSMANWKWQSVQFIITVNEPCREILNCEAAFMGSKASYFWNSVQNKPLFLSQYLI